MNNKNKKAASPFSGRRQWLLFTLLIATGFAGLRYAPLLGGQVPDFAGLTAGVERKSAFFDYMAPLVQSENERILEQRGRLVAIAEKPSPGWLDRRWLGQLAASYGVDEVNTTDPALVQDLLGRVDAVPMSLALAQAAKESGWGTSRFAREGHNYFGEWCFSAGCGIVPKARAEGRSHEVAAFSSPRASVASYLNNINSHPGYREFRAVRAQMRDEQRDLSGIALAATLSQYSERRDAYVEELRQLIVSNDLDSIAVDGSD